MKDSEALKALRAAAWERPTLPRNPLEAPKVSPQPDAWVFQRVIAARAKDTL